MNEAHKQAFETLSPRKRQVLELVSLRRNSKEIARELGVSPATVDSHVTVILNKLGVSSRRDAIVMLESDSLPLRMDGIHHGGNSLVPRPPWLSRQFRARVAGTGTSQSSGSVGSSMGSRFGLGSVLFRLVLDAFFVVVFFSTMSAAAYGVHEVVLLCEENNVDQIVIYMLKGVSYAIVALDGIGVVSATGVLTFRFVRAIVRVEK